MTTSSPSARPVKRLLTLIRHPETIANVAHLLQGSTDSPLSVHGRNQLAFLVKAIAASAGAVSIQAHTTKHSCSALLQGRHPSEIWSSPLPRAYDLASALAEAFEAKEGDLRRISVVRRNDLEEKSFGNRECSRSGTHVSGFPIGTKPYEDTSQWRARVRKEGLALLNGLSLLEDARQHLVVVTHGLWISCFFNTFLPAERLPFAENTGIFTLEFVTGDSQALQVLCANDTSHLVGLKRQRGGIGSSASDKRQRTLGDMWTNTSKKSA